MLLLLGGGICLEAFSLGGAVLLPARRTPSSSVRDLEGTSGQAMGTLARANRQPTQLEKIRE